MTVTTVIAGQVMHIIRTTVDPALRTAYCVLRTKNIFVCCCGVGSDRGWGGREPRYPPSAPGVLSDSTARTAETTLSAVLRNLNENMI